MKFISLRVRSALVVHGYTPDNRAVVERVEDGAFDEKIIAIDRIRSVSDQHVLVTGSHGRLVYWEYEGGIDAVRQQLTRSGLMLDGSADSSMTTCSSPARRPATPSSTAEPPLGVAASLNY